MDIYHVIKRPLVTEKGTHQAQISHEAYSNPEIVKTAPHNQAIRSLRPEPSEIYVMSADGSTQTRLTVLNGNSKYPRWSPDGSRIGFESDVSGNEEIYIMNADGSELTNITNHLAQERNVAWSPDGSKIIFASDRDGNFDLYVHELTPSVP